jgi:hypothetical protein
MSAFAGVAENMRMAALKLVGNALEDVGQGEMAGFFRHARMKYDLELQIAELVDQRVHIAAVNCVRDLIGFFDRIGGDCLKGLDAVPLATGFPVTQPLHDRGEAVEAPFHAPWSARGLKRPAARVILQV